MLRSQHHHPVVMPVVMFEFDAVNTSAGAIPANTTATVFLPMHDADAVIEGGKPARSAERGGEFAGVQDDRCAFRAGSGTCRFETAWKADSQRLADGSARPRPPISPPCAVRSTAPGGRRCAEPRATEVRCQREANGTALTREFRGEECGA